MVWDGYSYSALQFGHPYLPRESASKVCPHLHALAPCAGWEKPGPIAGADIAARHRLQVVSDIRSLARNVRNTPSPFGDLPQAVKARPFWWK